MGEGVDATRHAVRSDGVPHPRNFMNTGMMSLWIWASGGVPVLVPVARSGVHTTLDSTVYATHSCAIYPVHDSQRKISMSNVMSDRPRLGAIRSDENY